VHRHLVTVEVGIERGADQRVQLDGFALDQYRLECLDAEAMQRRRTVQENRVLADDFLENIPDLGTFTLHQPLRGLDGRCLATQLQLREDELLEAMKGKIIGQGEIVGTYERKPPQ
jgi:hypothetical protein